MSEEAARERIAVVWSPEARANFVCHRPQYRTADSILR